MTNYIQTKGAAAFGTRLRRLSERMDRDIQEVYGDYGVRFEPRWFPIVNALSDCGVLSVGQLAELIGVSHAAVSQLRAELSSACLIRSKPDPLDGRRQLIALTPSGRRQIKVLRPLWEAITRATIELCGEAAPDLLDGIDRLEAALRAKSMKQRVVALRPVKSSGIASAVVSHE